MERRAGDLRPVEVITDRSDAVVYIAGQMLLVATAVVAVIVISLDVSWGLVAILAVGVPAQILRSVLVRRVVRRHGDRVPVRPWTRRSWLQRQLDRLGVIRRAIAVLRGRNEAR